MPSVTLYFLYLSNYIYLLINFVCKIKKIVFLDGVSKEIQQKYSGSKKKNKNKDSEATQDDQVINQEPVKIHLTFKRYIYDPEKKMKQT
jgi:selenocysteine-specific elongation factor